MIFVEKMNEFDLFPGEMVLDGNIHRFKNMDDKGKNSWYIGFDNGDFQAGAFGCFKMGIHEKYSSISTSHMTKEQKIAYAKQQQELAAQVESIKLNMNNKAARQANNIFNKGLKNDVDSHQYLIDKDVASHGLKVNKEKLLIPMFNIDGEIVNIQSINISGEKRFHKGGLVKGCFYLIGEVKDIIVLCEGYATGATIYSAVKEATVICFNSSNLKNIALELSSLHPNASILIAGDDDQFNEINSGRIEAIKAAKHIGGYTVFPKFKDVDYGDKTLTDFNDLYRAYGLKEVKSQIYDAIRERTWSVNHSSFVFYESFFKACECLPNEHDKNSLFIAVCEYGLYERQIKLPLHVQGIFEAIKPQLDANIKKRKDGNKGKRPKKSAA
jgi:putative DNA primase/helicase